MLVNISRASGVTSSGSWTPALLMQLKVVAIFRDVYVKRYSWVSPLTSTYETLAAFKPLYGTLERTVVARESVTVPSLSDIFVSSGSLTAPPLEEPRIHRND